MKPETTVGGWAEPLGKVGCRGEHTLGVTPPGARGAGVRPLTPQSLGLVLAHCLALGDHSGEKKIYLELNTMIISTKVVF